MFEARIRVNLEALGKRLVELGDRLPATVREAARASVLDMAQHVVSTKLIHGAPQYLNRRTGTLVRSVTASPRATATRDRVRASFGTHLDYGRAHELGFHGTVTVRAHFRDPSDRPTHMVRAHSRRMNMRARHFLQDTLRERLPGVEPRVARALVILAKTGRVTPAGGLL